VLVHLAAVDALLSAFQVLLAVALVVLVLMHSGKDAGLSGAFGMSPGQSAFGGTAVMERNLTRLTIAVSVLFVVNGIALGFLL
jgi:preprotein translocase subunit SecG